MVSVTLENVRKIFFILLLIVGAQLSAAEEDYDIYIKYVDEITGSFIKESEKKYHLDCIGTGGKLARNVAGINISFIAYRKGTMEEARSLQVKMIEELLSKINNHEKIRPFLATYPFPAKNIGLSIAFRKKDNSRYADGSVVLVFQGRNDLCYCAEDPKTGKLIDLLEEPFQEAVKIVHAK